MGNPSICDITMQLLIPYSVDFFFSNLILADLGFFIFHNLRKKIYRYTKVNVDKNTRIKSNLDVYPIFSLKTMLKLSLISKVRHDSNIITVKVASTRQFFRVFASYTLKL